MVSSSFFKCPCCGYNNVDDKLVHIYNAITYLTEIKYHINSAVRCTDHNNKVGGSKTSSHLKGLAMDLGFKNSYECYKLIEAIIQLKIKRFGVYKTFIHVDIDDDKPQEVTWVS